jgi:hypothetical protein
MLQPGLSKEEIDEAFLVLPQMVEKGMPDKFVDYSYRYELMKDKDYSYSSEIDSVDIDAIAEGRLQADAFISFDSQNKLAVTAFTIWAATA